MAKQHRLPSDDSLHSRDGSAALRGLIWAGAAIGAAALANAALFYRTSPLTSQLPGGEVRYFPTANGDVFYKKAGDGPPLLLVHGIGAGNCSYEWRHVFSSLAEKHTVYAIDLLGFGKSDKPAIAYTAETFIDLIADFSRQVMEVGDGRGEADVIASSLSAAYVIALSQRDPSLFHRLVLVCPTGIDKLADPPTPASVAAQAVLKTPVVGTSLYNGIASKRYIRMYMRERLYADPEQATEEAVDYYYTAAHQPGADNVLPYFLGGSLNINIAEAFKGVVDLPLIVWGNKAKETPLSHAEDFLQINENAKLEVVEDAGMLPHYEKPAQFLTAVRPFLYGAHAAEEADADEALATA